NRELNNELLVLLETNIDDVNPQIYDYVSNRLLQEGALDVWLTPIQMKKNRPAVTLSILCRLTDEKELSGILFEEGLTLGIRRQPIDRASLPREIKIVKTKFGGIRVKIARYEEKIVRCVPEYEDCKKIAAEQSIPIQKVMNMVKGTALSTLSRN
ncbi:MAG: nickel insertion protein, partial [Patescibacteria group bacterium]